jgi:ferredoxin
MKLRVDRDLCEANRVCERLAPDVFRVDDDDVLHLLVEEPGGELLERVREAVDRCPRVALSLVEE